LKHAMLWDPRNSLNKTRLTYFNFPELTASLSFVFFLGGPSSFLVLAFLSTLEPEKVKPVSDTNIILCNCAN
jgi:hypothetical protein